MILVEEVFKKKLISRTGINYQILGECVVLIAKQALYDCVGVEEVHLMVPRIELLIHLSQ